MPSKCLSHWILRTPARRVASRGMLLAAAIVTVVGCQAEPRWGNPPPPPGTQQRLGAALRSTAAGFEPTHRLAPATSERGRWEDVPLAVYWAIGEDGVEMGIVRRETTEDGFIFHLKTIEGWPATLIVERRPGGQVYAARAEVGRFPEMPARQERASNLVRAFEAHMRALGRKPKPVPIENGEGSS